MHRIFREDTGWFARALRRVGMMTAMSYGYQSEIRKHWREQVERSHEQGLEQSLEQGKKQGRAEGEARSVLHILSRRQITVPERIRKRILRCTDTAQLDQLLDRAMTVTRAEDLFD